MKNLIFLALFTQLPLISLSQFVARAAIKENIDGICDKSNVYALLAMLKGQKEAICSVKDPAIEQMLNDSVQSSRIIRNITTKA